jgi:hypothetical protein
MDELTKLFDVLLIRTADYPITIYKLLFDPAGIFLATNDSRVCPASLTYVFTILLLYGYLNAMQEKTPDWFSPQLLVGVAAAYVAVIANLQEYVARSFFELDGITLQSALEALVYAFCPVLLFSSIVLLTLGGLNEDAATVVGSVGGAVLYVLGLYNVSSKAFHLPFGQALRCAFAMWGCFLVVVIVIGLVALPVLLRSENRSRRSSNPADDRGSTP